MNTTETVKGRYAECQGCGNWRYIYHAGRCLTCDRKARPAKIGGCPGCGLERELFCRGLCNRCYRSCPPGSGEKARRRADSAEDVAKAVERRAAFELVLLPDVVRTARRRCRWWHSLADREDFVADCCALAWACFVREVARGRDPLTYVGSFVGHVVGDAQRWARLGGPVPPDDALSERARHAGAVRVSRREEDYDRDRRDQGAEAEAELLWKLWLATLPERDRALLEFLRAGGRRKDAEAVFAVSRKTLYRRLDGLADAWEKVLRG